MHESQATGREKVCATAGVTSASAQQEMDGIARALKAQYGKESMSEAVRMVPLSEGAFHLDDYIFYVQDFIRLLAPDLHVISVCQPTVTSDG